ncbi:MAG: AMP-binding protein [Desulfobacterales bacterium]|nr:AMP-binding protein [Desulfobacterales bacterium]
MIPGAVPWPEEWEEKYLRECWPDKTFGQVFLESVEKNGDRIAVVEGDVRISYRELGEKVKGLACGLMNLGLKPTERVLFQLPNSLEFFYAYWACHLAGLISVMCLPPHREAELIHLGTQTEASAYMIPDLHRGHDYQDMAKEIQAQCPTLRHVIVSGDAREGYLSLGELLETPRNENQDFPKPDPREVAILQLSGGTTGTPKIIPHTHNDYIYKSRAIIGWMGFTGKDIMMVPLLFAHNACLQQMIHPALLTGATAVVCPFDPESISRTIEKEKVTYLFTVPPIFYRWLEFPDFAKYDYSSLRLSMTGAQKMHPSQAYRVGKELTAVFMQGFGITEGTHIFPRLTDSEKVRYETIGRPISPWDEIRVVDEEGKEVLPGELGELICRGPYTIRGYYKAEEHNRKAYDDDGFFWTGDLVRSDEYGNLVIEGRSKDVINRGGEKISAEEVEDLLIDHPKVNRVAVVAMPDPELGEKACAYIVPEKGAEPTLRDLTEHLARKKVAKFKYPERLELLDAFPYTNVGKVSKKTLREDVEAKLSREGGK